MAPQLDVNGILVELDRDISKMANWAVNSRRVFTGYMDAEDLAQEARVKLLEVLEDSYDPDKGDVKTYAMVLVYRVFANINVYMRRIQRGSGKKDLRIVNKLAGDQQQPGFIDESMVGCVDDSMRIMEHDLRECLLCFSEIDEGWRALFQVFESGGLRDASRVMRTTTKNLRSTVTRMMGRMLPADFCEAMATR